MIMWRPRTRVDETLDVLAAHGLAGFTGILFLGLVAQIGWNGVADGLFYGDAGQFWSQVVAAAVTPAYAFIVTFILLKLVGAVDAAAGERARRGARQWTSSSTARRPT
jgi:Amt family ammonium transporter